MSQYPEIDFASKCQIARGEDGEGIGEVFKESGCVDSKEIERWMRQKSIFVAPLDSTRDNVENDGSSETLLQGKEEQTQEIV